MPLPEGPAPPGDGTPLFSVIVPVYRHWDLIPTLLAGLREQTLPQSAFEVILVNNDPATPPPPLDLPANTRILPCAAPGSYAARNAGAAAARGHTLAFTDADCRPAPGWLAALAAARDDKALLAGPVEITPEGNPPNRYEIYDRIRGIPQARYVSRGYAATANLAAPAPVFAAVGGFNPMRFSGGDGEFCLAARALGHPIRLVGDAVVHHPARTTWNETATKARRVKGGQIMNGPPRRRALWLLRTLTPPLRATRRHLQAPLPWGQRLSALRVLYALWFVELAETARVLTGGERERR